MAKISPLVIFLVLEIIRSSGGLQTNPLHGNNEGNDDSLGSDSLDLLKNIKLINEISMDEALVESSPRSKRSLKGGSVLRRRHARRNAVPMRYEAEETIQIHPSLSAARSSGHSLHDKREVGRQSRQNRKTVSENGEKKQNMFLANLLFAQTAKMPQPLETLFTNSLM